jgi:hypothetical protein
MVDYTGPPPQYTRPYTLTYTFSLLSTTYTETGIETYQKGPGGTQVPLDGNLCQYQGIGCWSTQPEPTGTLQSLKNAEKSAELYACERTIITSLAYASFTKETFVETVMGPSWPSGFNNYGHATVISSITTSYVTTFESMVSRPAYDQYGCCGKCALMYANVNVYYFPPADWTNGTTCIHDPNFDALSGMEASQQAVQTMGNHGALFKARELPITTLVNSNGYTFTSPSIYVGFTEAMGRDQCGIVGKVHKDFTLAFAPGELLTGVGEFGYWAYSSRPFDPSSVTCYSKPYILMPSKILEVDPAWRTCSADLGQGNDPPHALTPEVNLGTAPAWTTPPGGLHTTPADPGQGAPQMPSTTAMFNPSPAKSMDPVPTPGGGNSPQPQKSDLPKNNPSPVQSQGDPAAMTPEPKPVPTIVIATIITTTTNGHVEIIPIYSLSTVNADPSPAGASQPPLGGVIMSGFSAPAVATSSGAASPGAGSAPTIVIPSQIIVAPGTTLVLGGPSLTNDGTTMYYGTAGVVVGTETLQVPGVVATTVTSGSGIGSVVIVPDPSALRPTSTGFAGNTGDAGSLSRSGSVILACLVAGIAIVL